MLLSTYQKAFVRYLRHGTPVELALKTDTHPTPHYIWRTRKDGKTRPAHAVNEGKIFAWNDPPPTGHPGEDYGCRCWAEPYYGVPPNPDGIPIIEYFKALLARGKKWENIHFVAHFYVGNGRTVTLDEIGQLDDVRNYYTTHYFPRFKKQIFDKAATLPDGAFEDYFDKSYQLRSLLFSHGKSTFTGVFSGKAETVMSGGRFIQGDASISFYDVFTDPVDIVDILADHFGIKNPWQWIKRLAEVGGTKYTITGYWDMAIRGYTDEL